MFGHLQRLYREMTPLDDEDDEVLCLADRLLDETIDDEFTTRHTARAYSEGRLPDFRGRMRTALAGQVKGWKGTNMRRFTAAMRDLNKRAQTGLRMIEHIATDDVSHEWPTAKEMWAWRGAKMADPGSVMHCFKDQL
jgi:hypothetical protein